ncbi:hypothetical protein LINGRAPRIM_LOCUS2935 [Linum grandiflorum]
MEARLRALAITEDEERIEEVEDLVPTAPSQENYQLCVVGRFLTDRVFNFEVVKERLAEIRRPQRGLSIRGLEDRRLLFRFYHKLDLRWVVDNGPWNHNGCLLILHEMQPGDQPMMVRLAEARFWLCVYKLPPGFFMEAVAKTVGNFVGSFLHYDPV